RSYCHSENSASTPTPISGHSSLRSPWPNTNRASNGTMNWRSCATSTNNQDIGCSRRSGAAPAVSATTRAGGAGSVIFGVDGTTESLAQAFGVGGIEVGHGNRTVAGAGRVHDQGGQLAPALQWPALDVEVLDPVGRYPGFALPQPATAHCQSLLVQSPRGVPVLAGSQPDAECRAHKARQAGNARHDQRAREFQHRAGDQGDEATGHQAGNRQRHDGADQEQRP